MATRGDLPSPTIWVLEWCSAGTQKGLFHIDTLASSVRENLNVLMGTAPGIGPRSPWLIVGAFRTEEEAHATADELQRVQEQLPFGLRTPERIETDAPMNEAAWLSDVRALPYEMYLMTGHWKQVRERALNFAGHRCQVCNGDQELDVHHRAYENLGREQYSDVIVLCRECHQIFHERGRLRR